VNIHASIELLLEGNHPSNKNPQHLNILKEEAFLLNKPGSACWLWAIKAIFQIMPVRIQICVFFCKKKTHIWRDSWEFIVVSFFLHIE